MNSKLSMKWVCLFLLVFLIAKDGYMSGMEKKIELNSRLSKQHNVYAVKIIGSSSVRIKEIGEVSKDTAVANQHYYSAQIIEIVNRCESCNNDEEPWTMLFSPGENPVLPKIKANGTGSIAINDTILIMDRENLHYTYIYEVEGLRKIVYYYTCADIAKSINIGDTYLFIGGRTVSKKNGVFYGNVDYGLYPNTKSMKNKITNILKTNMR